MNTITKVWNGEEILCGELEEVEMIVQLLIADQSIEMWVTLQRRAQLELDQSI